MGDLNQDAGAVACFRIASASSAVRKADQDLDSLLDDFAALLTANAGDKSHPACIMLVGRVVQPLGGGQTARDPSRLRHDLLYSTTYWAWCALVQPYARPLRSSSDKSPSSLVHLGLAESTIRNFDSSDEDFRSK